MGEQASRNSFGRDKRTGKPLCSDRKKGNGRVNWKGTEGTLSAPAGEEGQIALGKAGREGRKKATVVRTGKGLPSGRSGFALSRRGGKRSALR